VQALVGEQGVGEVRPAQVRAPEHGSAEVGASQSGRLTDEPGGAQAAPVSALRDERGGAQVLGSQVGKQLRVAL